MPKLASRESWFLLLFFITTLLAAFLSVSLLQDKVIGAIDHPGLQGEILFQKNIIYNFEKGNLFNHFKTDYLNYPFGENLGFILANSLHLFMYIPLKFFFGIIEAYNILVIIIFLLNFLSAYFLTKYLFSSKPVAFCSALVFALNPYVLLKMNMGFINKIAMFWIPLYLLALFKLQTTKKWCYIFLAGIVLCLMQLTYPPYSFYMLIFTMGLGVYYLFKREQLFFAFTRFIALLFFCTVFGALIYYLMGFGFIYGQNLKPMFQVTTDGCLDLFRPFLFFPYHSANYPAHLPLGISLICFFCGLIAFIKNVRLSRLLILNLALFLIIAAGPYLIHNGEFVYFLGRKVNLPFYIIAKYIPLGGIFFPIRVFPFINICLAILTGYGLLTFKKIKSSLITILFLVIYLSELIILFPRLFPPRISDVYIPKFYQKIKNENFEAVLNLPVSSDRKVVNRYGYYAALSGKKMMNPYHKNELQIYLPKDVDNQQVKEDFIEFLSDWNVGYVIMHGDFLPRDTEDVVSHEFSWLEAFCELTVYSGDNLFVYKVPSSDKVKRCKNMIYIPKDYPSIQQGIDAAGDGDILLVNPGRYKGCIDFKGKRITVKSKDGPKVTIIDGDKKGSVVVFNSGENNKSVLEGFTIQNGLEEYGKNKGGGGILCYKSSPLIKNNIIKNNKAENGGGILCQDCLDKKPLIISNLIKNNEAVKGGGIRCSDSSPIIVNNIIIGNNAKRLGGGIYWRQNSSPYIVNNTIMYNIAGEYGGGVFASNYITLEAPVVLSNTIFWGNRAPRGTQIALNLSGTKVTVASSVVQYGKNGVFLMTDNISLNYLPDNISADPRIKEIDKTSLMSSSACIDAGENEYIASLDIAVDFNGNNRILDGNGDGKSNVDIGACEFDSSRYIEKK